MRTETILTRRLI